LLSREREKKSGIRDANTILAHSSESQATEAESRTEKYSCWPDVLYSFCILRTN
jgi:hypothetical protein